MSYLTITQYLGNPNLDVCSVNYNSDLKKFKNTTKNTTNNRVKVFNYLVASNMVKSPTSYIDLTRIKNPPNIWGPKIWLKIHLMSMNYPKKPTIMDKKTKITEISKIPSILPCPICSKDTLNYISNNIDLLYEALEDREKLILFFFNFHNYVNKKLGKVNFSLDNFKKLYNVNINI